MIYRVSNCGIMCNNHKNIILAVSLLELPNSLDNLRNVVAESRNEEWVVHASTPRLLQFSESPARTESDIAVWMTWMRMNGLRYSQVFGWSEQPSIMADVAPQKDECVGIFGRSRKTTEVSNCMARAVK